MEMAAVLGQSTPCRRPAVMPTNLPRRTAHCATIDTLRNVLAGAQTVDGHVLLVGFVVSVDPLRCLHAQVGIVMAERQKQAVGSIVGQDADAIHGLSVLELWLGVFGGQYG